MRRDRRPRDLDRRAVPRGDEVRLKRGSDGVVRGEGRRRRDRRQRAGRRRPHARVRVVEP